MSDTKFTDVVWCAGFFEGEGWIHLKVSHPTDRKLPRITVIAGITNTEIAHLRRFEFLWGGRIRPLKISKLGKKPIFEWRIEGAKVAPFLSSIEPFVFGEKRERLLRGLALRERMTMQGRARTGRGRIASMSGEEFLCRTNLIQ